MMGSSFMAFFFNPVSATVIATSKDESITICLLQRKVHLSNELRPSAQISAQSKATKMTIRSERRAASFASELDCLMCSATVGEDDGGKANNFL
jgi:hypothetical protein